MSASRPHLIMISRLISGFHDRKWCCARKVGLTELTVRQRRNWCILAAADRLHLDVPVGTGLVGEERVAALEAECARLVALGAVRVRLLPADGDDESCLVMQDIEGNEFCLD
jgi:hypothetical protein